jgi:hypothetical protein
VRDVAWFVETVVPTLIVAVGYVAIYFAAGRIAADGLPGRRSSLVGDALGISSRAVLLAG